MTGIWWGTRAAVKWYSSRNTSLSRNFFTDIRNASVDKPMPRFASSISSFCKPVFFLHVLFKKKLANGPRVTLLFSLTCSVVFLFTLSPHIWLAFPALIPPSFTSLNPFEAFFRPFQPLLAAAGERKLRRFRLYIDIYIENAVTRRNMPYTRNQVASEWVKKISVRSWVELYFTIMSHILSFNYSYIYEINLIHIMYAANSSILYCKEKTGRILGTWHQYLVNVLASVIPNKLNFQKN